MASPGALARAPISRSDDRRITALGIALAALFVLAAGLSTGAPPEVRLGLWLPLHLLLAGGAATAIAGVMPYFSASVAMVAPAPGPLRLLGVLAVAGGAVLVTLSRSRVDVVGLVGTAGGVVYLAGLGAVWLATLMPLRAALGSRRTFLGVPYGAALAAVMVGAALGTLFLAGWGPVLSSWDVIKPAHAWLNTFGFVSLVIGATLIHLLPTVAAARIETSRPARVAIAGLVVGPLLGALGFLARSDALAVTGAAVTLLAAIALAIYGLDVMRRRNRWTSDFGWHRFAIGSLCAGIAWFLAGTVVAFGLVAGGGAASRGWDIRAVAAPMACGWVLQVLAGSWTHLVPSIGPGSPVVHARQRVILGQLDRFRFWLFQAGVLGLAVTLPTDLAGPATAALAAVAVSLATSLALLLRAGLEPTRDRRASAAAPPAKG